MSGDRTDASGDDAARQARRASRRLRRETKLARADGILRGLTAALGQGDVCVDCGAHYGRVTARLAATGADIHAFEPDPHSWTRLRAACGARPNVTLHNAAVAVTAGRLTLFRTEGFARDTAAGSTGSSVFAQNSVVDPGTAQEVPAVSLPDFLRDLLTRHDRIAFLKLDVEGAEVDLLEHLIGTDILPRINLTAVETHRWLFPDWADRYRALYETAAARPDLNLFLNWI